MRAAAAGACGSRKTGSSCTLRPRPVRSQLPTDTGAFPRKCVARFIVSSAPLGPDRVAEPSRHERRSSRRRLLYFSSRLWRIAHRTLVDSLVRRYPPCLASVLLTMHHCNRGGISPAFSFITVSSLPQTSSSRLASYPSARSAAHDGCSAPRYVCCSFARETHRCRSFGHGAQKPLPS